MVALEKDYIDCYGSEEKRTADKRDKRGFGSIKSSALSVSGILVISVSLVVASSNIGRVDIICLVYI